MFCTASHHPLAEGIQTLAQLLLDRCYSEPEKAEVAHNEMTTGVVIRVRGADRRP